MIDNKMNIPNKLYVTNQFYGCVCVGGGGKAWDGGSDLIICFIK